MIELQLCYNYAALGYILWQREEVEVARPLQRARRAEEKRRGELRCGVREKVVDAKHDGEEDDESHVEVLALAEAIEQHRRDDGGEEATDLRAKKAERDV